MRHWLVSLGTAQRTLGIRVECPSIDEMQRQSATSALTKYKYILYVVCFAKCFEARALCSCRIAWTSSTSKQ